MIVISTIDYDIEGAVQINPLPNSGNEGAITRRVNRVATLDGGAALNDGGFSEADKDFVYTWKTISKAHTDQIERLQRLYPKFHLSNSKGVFLVAMPSFRPGPEESEITLLSLGKLT